MGRSWKILLPCLCLPVLLGGCSREERATQVPVVTQVEIVSIQEGTRIERCYTGQQKIVPVLNYLRMLDDQGRTDVDPERVFGDVYRIRICLSNGKEHVYWQRADRYVSRDRHAWRLVDSEQAKQLHGILQETPSDR